VLLGGFIYHMIDIARYKTDDLKERRKLLLYCCEFLPLLGLAGTVLGLLNTLSAVKPGVEVSEVIRSFSPALSTTLSAMICLMINLIANARLEYIIQGRE